jgi:hypothetical protein
MMGTEASVSGNLVVVKIGGSAITDKNGVEALKHDQLGRPYFMHAPALPQHPHLAPSRTVSLLWPEFEGEVFKRPSITKT